MQKITVLIKGMHCKACEMLVEERLSEIKNIKKVRVNVKTGRAEIYFEGDAPSEKDIEEAINEAGYDIGANDKKSLLSKNAEDYKDITVALIFILGLYLILKNLGFGSLNFAASSARGSNPSSLGVVFLVGLTAGLSTCMALVGGLILGISARHSEKHPEASAAQKFRPHLFFNLGRVISFAVLGGLLGFFGSLVQFSSLVQGILIILVGVVMLLMGLKLTNIFPFLEKANFAMPKIISKIFSINKNEKEYSHTNSFVLGALTFFLPCGFTQTMQVLAIGSGSFVSGSMIMGTFALGTVPGLLGIGGLASAVKGIFARRFFKFAGVLVILMAMFNISNGLNLTGWKSFGESGGGSNSGICKTSESDCAVTNSASNASTGNIGFQTINMTEDGSGYSPSALTVKKGIPVHWIIDAKEPYSCASSLVVPSLGIRKNLQVGQNEIDFTPTQAGTIPFSCSMGMYTGKIIVE